MMDENGHHGSSYVLFVWSPAGWTLQQRDGEPPPVGATIENGETLLTGQQDRPVTAAGRPAPLRVHPARLDRLLGPCRGQDPTWPRETRRVLAPTCPFTP